LTAAKCRRWYRHCSKGEHRKAVDPGGPVEGGNLNMATPPVTRRDLDAWLADLRKVGGQARTLAERHHSIDNMMNLDDLQMLEEATKRLIVTLNKNMMYAVQSPRAAATPGVVRFPRPSAGTEPPKHRSHSIVGPAGPMRRVHQLIDKAAACSLPVLIQGESGTGKELVARAIYERSTRKERRFFSENCSALSESLLESELFGHVRGAFTGADRDRKGILELADGGSLFLDEIGDMSLRMQSKLLRALQEGELRPVGGKETIRVDVRIISATNHSLLSLIKEGGFREDLFYRINVVTINLPPLRDRKADVPALVEHFLDRIAADTGLPRKHFTPGALELLMGYEWPGNIRELENVVQRRRPDHRRRRSP
jgi:transcriptional regulator with GAF, ATPase, and Fis domain